MFAFSALLARMKFIGRWGLMRQLRNENLAEHTLETAMLVHLLAKIGVHIFKKKDICPEKLAVAALYHDACEILTGDMPTPVKYQNLQLKEEYKKLEAQATKRLCKTLPQELSPVFEGLINGMSLNEYEKKLLKACDKLSALIKCIEETQSSNMDFQSAKEAQLKILFDINLPEVDYFMEKMLPAFTKNLDQLAKL